MVTREYDVLDTADLTPVASPRVGDALIVVPETGDPVRMSADAFATATALAAQHNLSAADVLALFPAWAALGNSDAIPAEKIPPIVDAMLSSGKVLMTDAERAKLLAIEGGADANVQSDWIETDSASDSYIQNKPSPIPTATTTEAEAGAETTLRQWTPALVKDAIDALSLQPGDAIAFADITGHPRFVRVYDALPPTPAHNEVVALTDGRIFFGKSSNTFTFTVTPGDSHEAGDDDQGYQRGDAETRPYGTLSPDEPWLHSWFWDDDSAEIIMRVISGTDPGSSAETRFQHQRFPMTKNPFNTFWTRQAEHYEYKHTAATSPWARELTSATWTVTFQNPISRWYEIDSSTTGPAIVEKLEGLTGDARLSYGAIKNTPTGQAATIHTGNTLSGDGSIGDPVDVVNPYPDTDEQKLASIPNPSSSDAGKVLGINAAGDAYEARTPAPSGGGGLTAVHHDDTLSGQGTPASEMRVTLPKTQAEQDKIAAIPNEGISAAGQLLGFNASGRYAERSPDEFVHQYQTLPVAAIDGRSVMTNNGNHYVGKSGAAFTFNLTTGDSHEGGDDDEGYSRGRAGVASYGAISVNYLWLSELYWDDDTNELILRVTSGTDSGASVQLRLDSTLYTMTRIAGTNFWQAAGNHRYEYRVGGNNPWATTQGATSTITLTFPSALTYWDDVTASGGSGERGPQGERGLQGIQGEQGERGPPGADGSDGTVASDGTLKGDGSSGSPLGLADNYRHKIDRLGVDGIPVSGGDFTPAANHQDIEAERRAGQTAVGTFANDTGASDRRLLRIHYDGDSGVLTAVMAGAGADYAGHSLDWGTHALLFSAADLSSDVNNTVQYDWFGEHSGWIVAGTTYTWAVTEPIDASDLLPEQSGHNGQYLKTDGTNADWEDLDVEAGDLDADTDEKQKAFRDAIGARSGEPASGRMLPENAPVNTEFRSTESTTLAVPRRLQWLDSQITQRFMSLVGNNQILVNGLYGYSGASTGPTAAYANKVYLALNTSLPSGTVAKTPAKLQYGSVFGSLTEYNIASASTGANRYEVSGLAYAGIAVGAPGYFVNIVFTDNTKLWPDRTYPAGLYDSNGFNNWTHASLHVVPQDLEADTAEEKLAFRNRLDIASVAAAITKIHSGFATGFINGAGSGSDVTTAGTFDTVFDLDDTDKQLGVIPVAVTFELFGRSSNLISFIMAANAEEAGDNLRVRVTGFVTASEVRGSQAFNAGSNPPQLGVLVIDDVSIYKSNAEIGKMDFYLSRDASNGMGYSIHYEGLAGSDTFTVTLADLEVVFEHQDESSGGTGGTDATLTNLVLDNAISINEPSSAGAWTSWDQIFTRTITVAGLYHFNVNLDAHLVTTQALGGGDRVFTQYKIERTRASSTDDVWVRKSYIRSGGNFGETEVNNASQEESVQLTYYAQALVNDVYTVRARYVAQTVKTGRTLQFPVASNHGQIVRLA